MIALFPQTAKVTTPKLWLHFGMWVFQQGLCRLPLQSLAVTVPGCDSSTGRVVPGGCSPSQRCHPSPSWSSCCRHCPGKAQSSFPLAHICCLCPQPSPPQCWLLLAAHGAEPRGLCASHVPLLCQGLPGSPAPQRHLGFKLNQQALLQPCPLQLTLSGATAGWITIIFLTICMKKA